MLKQSNQEGTENRKMERKKTESVEITNRHTNGKGINTGNVVLFPEKEGNMLLESVKTRKLKTGFLLGPATMDDLEETVDMFNLFAREVIGNNEVSLEDVRKEWLLPEFDLNSNTRLVRLQDGKIVGYVEVWDTDTPPVNIWVWGRVHPDFEGQGIGTQMMNWAEERALMAVNRVPEGIRVVMRSGTYNTHKPSHQLFENRSMHIIRHFYRMAIELDERPAKPEWQNGISLQTIDNGTSLRDVFWAINDAFRDHWGHVERPFEQEYRRWHRLFIEDKNYDPTLSFLAMDGDQIAGFSLCSAKIAEDPDMGWVNTLGVRRSWRRQGVALNLLKHSFNEFYDRGKKRVGLGVDAGSLTGATRLYKKAGMNVYRQFDSYEKELRPGKDITTQSLET